jgi:hypothetical protein
MITKLSQVLEQIENIGRRSELAYRLHSRPFGGWRGLFDPLCSEWNNTEVPEKIDFLRTLVKETGVRIHGIVELYKKTYREKDRLDIVYATDEGLCELMEYMLLGLDKKKPGRKKKKAPRR